MTRALRPRQAAGICPALVSQLTSLQVLSVDARRYLEVIVPACMPDVIHVGKLRLVEVERAVEALRTLTALPDCEQRDTDPRDDDLQPKTAAAVLARLGMELVP